MFKFKNRTKSVRDCDYGDSKILRPGEPKGFSFKNVITRRGRAAFNRQLIYRNLSAGFSYFGDWKNK